MKLWLVLILLLITSCGTLLERREVVKISYTVNAKGEPENIKVLKSSNAKLNQAAIDSIKSWRFQKGSQQSANHVVKLQFDRML